MQSPSSDKKTELDPKSKPSLFADPDMLAYQSLYNQYKKNLTHHPELSQTFDKLFELVVTQKNIGEYYKKLLINTAYKLTPLLSLQNIETNNQFQLFQSYLAEPVNIETWDALKPKLDQLITLAHYRKFEYKENPAEIETTVGRFDREVDFKLPADELKGIQGLFKKSTDFRKSFILATDGELDNVIKKAFRTLKTQPDNKDFRAIVAAVFREKMLRLYGIYPNNIQIINFFALLNNPRRIAQIKTGEGKSLIIAMLSAYYALMGRKVDIITTSPDLALPQSQQYTPFYQSLGLSVSCNAGEERNCDPEVYKADIVYGTADDFAAAKLQDGMGGNIETVQPDEKSPPIIRTDGATARGNRPYDLAIVDEVDSMFLDTGNECIWVPLAEENPEIIPLYETIWHYVATHDNPDLTELMHFINSRDIGIEFREDDARLDVWLHPLMLAACRAKSSEEKKEYIVKVDTDGKKSIEIVNLPTGKIEFGMRWNRGLHAFVELKHGIRPKCTIDVNAASISPPDLFSNYEFLIGLTGTLGSAADRAELAKVYQVDMYASPTFSEKTNVFEIEPLIVEDEREQFAIILKRIQDEKGKPAHIVMDSIGSVERFKLFLTEILAADPKYKINTYDRQQNLSDLQRILTAAGQPFAITLTTNIGGRGADVPLSKEALDLGGLFEITTYPPQNERIEKQASGRAGRKGESGITQVIVHKGQLKQLAEMKLEAKDSYADFRIKRDAYNEKVSLYRQKDRLLLTLQYAANEFYFSLPMAIKNQLIKSWAVDCYNPLVEYIENIKDFLQNNPNFYAMTDKIDFEAMVAKLLVDKIEAFWKKNSAVIAEHLPDKKIQTAEGWSASSKNKFTERLFAKASQMKTVAKPEAVLEAKKQVEMVMDLDLTLLPEFTGGTFERFASDKAKPQDGIVHFEELKQFVSANTDGNVNYTVASFGINTARSQRVINDLKIENGQTLGFHPEQLDVVLDEKKVAEKCSQQQSQWGVNCMTNLTQLLAKVGFGQPPDLDLFRMCQLTMLTATGETGKNIHLLLSLLLRLQSGKQITDLVFVDDDPKNIEAARQFHLALPHLAILLKKPELANIKIHPVLAEVKEVAKNKFQVKWFERFAATMGEVLSVEKSVEKSKLSDSSIMALLARKERAAEQQRVKSQPAVVDGGVRKDIKRD